MILVHEPTGIAAEASERRSRAENRKVALGRLRMKLALEHRTPAAASGPSALWIARTRSGRLVISPQHDDFPAMVAEALDQLQASHFEVPRVAQHFGISPSQLVRFFKKTPSAWVALNRHRAATGLPTLK